jgi:hypothetical protein
MELVRLGDASTEAYERLSGNMKENMVTMQPHSEALDDRSGRWTWKWCCTRQEQHQNYCSKRWHRDVGLPGPFHLEIMQRQGVKLRMGYNPPQIQPAPQIYVRIYQTKPIQKSLTRTHTALHHFLFPPTPHRTISDMLFEPHQTMGLLVDGKTNTTAPMTFCSGVRVLSYLFPYCGVRSWARPTGLTPLQPLRVETAPPHTTPQYTPIRTSPIQFLCDAIWNRPTEAPTKIQPVRSKQTRPIPRLNRE